MGFMDWLRRVSDEGKEPEEPTKKPSWDSFKPKPMPPTPPRASHPARMTARALAKQLAAEYPNGVPVDVLVDRSDAAGLDDQDVDDALDRLAEFAEVKVKTINLQHLGVLDLSGLDSTRTRIVGTGYYLAWEERRKFGGLEYLLMREPDNEHDPKAVAVYGTRGRMVGHLSAAKAASYSPLLQQLRHDAYRVAGVGATSASGVLWVDLPRLPALRQFLKDRG